MELKGTGMFATIRVLLLTFTFCHVSGTTKASKPHIVMIVADDLGWDDVSFHGSPQIPTPNIDELANGGVILNSHYVSPICTPTRASIMTGKHPVNLGLQHGTIYGTQPSGLPLKEKTTPQYLKSLGYSTRGVGKWHLGFFEKEYTPTFRGFDSFYGYWTGKTDYWDHRSYEDYWGLDLRDDMKPVKNESGHYNTELFTEVAERIISTHDKSIPLYLYISHEAVHTGNLQDPLQAPQRLLDKFPHFISNDRRKHAAMVASLDESVGNITKALKKNGLFDNSVIVFITDNGGAPRGFDWSQGCNYPFKGGKDTLWEGGVRGVAFVHSKLIPSPGRVSFELIDVTDWLPTFYSLAGGDVTKIQDMIDGMNMWATIAHGAVSPRTEVLHNVDSIRKFAAIRVNQFKLIVNQDAVYNTTWHPRYDIKGEPTALAQPSTLPGAVIDCGLRDGSEKANCDTNSFPCLFDISKDPCEYNNIAHTHLPKVRLLLRRILEIQKKAAPIWYPARDPMADPALLGDIWGPWIVRQADGGHNDTKSTLLPFADEKGDNVNAGHVTSPQSLACCLKYSRFGRFGSFDKRDYNGTSLSSNNDTAVTDRANGSQATNRDCCHSNSISGAMDETQVRECCLRNQPRSFSEYVAIQSEKDKEVYELLHEILDIPMVRKRDSVIRNKKKATKKRSMSQPGR